MTAAVRPFPSTKPPPIESLGKAYFTPLMAPLPVTTRLPQPAPNAESITRYLRIESGGGVQQPNWYLWDVSLILLSYAPNEDEVAAEENIGTALGWGAAAAGMTITLRSGAKWFVTYAKATGLATKKGDPYVDLARYRGMVTWRVMGQPLLEPS